MEKQKSKIISEGSIDSSIKRTVIELLDKFKLNWSVSKLPLFAVSEEGEMIESASFEISRVDTNAALGTVGSEYQAVQNTELAEILIRAVKHSIPSSDILRFTGREYKGGKVVMLQVKLKPVKIGEMILNRHINVLNSHDGTIAVNYGMGHSFPEMGSFRQRAAARFRHSGTVMERVKQAVEIIQESYLKEKNLLDKYQLMMLIKVDNSSILKGYLREMFELKSTRIPDLSTKRMNQITDWKALWEKISKEYGNNVFSLFLSTIYYTNHVKADKFKDVSIMAGKSYDMNLRCYKFIERSFRL